MKAFGIAIMLVIDLFSCNGGVATQSGLDWNFYKKKSDGATVKILCTIQDLNEFNYLKTYLKPFLKDSFGINALIYYVHKDRIVKTLLDDSKRSNKVVYDLVIADPDIMQSLFTLGLLYGKYLNTLPNNRYLDYSFINSLKPYTELRDYVVPYACNQYVLLHDSCYITAGNEINTSDIQSLTVLKDENYIYNLYYLFRKSGIGDLTYNKSNQDIVKTQQDSFLHLLKSKAILSKDLIKRFKNDGLKEGVLRSSQGKYILSNYQMPDVKITYLENNFPVYYKMAAITNTSINVIAAMVTLNELISKKFQMNKYIKTFEDDLPVLNLDAELNNSNTDSTFHHIEFNKLTRSKLIFSIADIREANSWWKEVSKK